MRWAFLVWMLLSAMGCAQRQSPLSTGSGGGTAAQGTPLFSQIGSYLTIYNCKAGQSVLYRTDGGPVTIASILYSGPITVTTGEVVSAICATIGAYQTNVQASSASAVCYTASGGTFTGPPSTTCGSSGGVGTINPANVAWTVASSAIITVTTPAKSTTSVQGLFEHLFSGNADPSPARCDSCTTQVQDFVLTASAGPSTFMNIETDMPQYMPTVYAPLTTGVNRQNGFQCNQHSDHDWEVDSGNAGGWTDTGIPCSYAAGVPKEVVLRVSHANGDTGCGGQGCANYTDLWDNGVHHALGGTYGGTQGYAAQTGSKGWGTQKQPDFQTTSGTALSGTLTVTSETVAMGTGDESAPQSYTAL